MGDLSQVMQERLEKWRKNVLPVKSAEILRNRPSSRRNGKNDYGDVMSAEEWDEEIKKSQTRK